MWEFSFSVFTSVEIVYIPWEKRQNTPCCFRTNQHLVTPLFFLHSILTRQLRLMLRLGRAGTSAEQKVTTNLSPILSTCGIRRKEIVSPSTRHKPLSFSPVTEKNLGVQGTFSSGWNCNYFCIARMENTPEYGWWNWSAHFENNETLFSICMLQEEKSVRFWYAENLIVCFIRRIIGNKIFGIWIALKIFRIWGWAKNLFHTSFLSVALLQMQFPNLNIVISEKRPNVCVTHKCRWVCLFIHTSLTLVNVVSPTEPWLSPPSINHCQSAIFEGSVIVAVWNMNN